MTGFFKGTATALVTPFDEWGVNEGALIQMIQSQIEGGIDALVICGTTGESAAMTDKEREFALSCAITAAKGRIKIIAGTGSNCTENAVRLSKMAQRLGADGLLVVTPYYNRCTQTGLYEYYKTVASAVEIPVLCYNVPSRTGINLLPETMDKIAEIKNIAGIKEASGNMSQILRILSLIKGRCDLYSGDDMLNLPILACGGSGVISVVSNLAPQKVNAMVKAVFHENYTLARSLAEELLPLIDACFCEGNPIPVKEGLNLLGFHAGLPRPPLTRLSEEHRFLMKEALLHGGLL